MYDNRREAGVLICYQEILVTPRSEEEGGTGPDTLYSIMTNEVQRSHPYVFPEFPFALERNRRFVIENSEPDHRFPLALERNRRFVIENSNLLERNRRFVIEKTW